MHLALSNMQIPGEGLKIGYEPKRGVPTQPLSPEALHTEKVGIYNETDRLRKVTIWGAVGSEAVLAQLYPQDISLFYEYMNVHKARGEALSYSQTLQKYGVGVHMVRDELAGLITPQQGLGKDQIISAILTRARDIRHQYQTHGAFRRFTQVGDGYKDAIVELVEQDIARYGEERALALNRLLSLDAPLPLGNSIYARDQMNVLLGTRFQSTMAKPIRRGEVALYEQVYQQAVGLPPAEVFPVGETFEGGDAYIHNNTVYVGVGIRTTKGAAEHIYTILKPQLGERGMQFAIVEDPDPASRPQKEQMDFMHLDTFSAAIGDREIAVCEEEVSRRRVKYLQSGNNGSVETIDTGDTFLEHLLKQEDRVVIIPREEQQEFGCNFLALDENTILLPLDSNPATNRQLTEAGKEIVFLGLYESTRGYGASHCMTGQLVRAR